MRKYPFVALIALIALLASACESSPPPAPIPTLGDYEVQLTDGTWTSLDNMFCTTSPVPDNGHGDWGNDRTPVLFVECAQNLSEAGVVRSIFDGLYFIIEPETTLYAYAIIRK